MRLILTRHGETKGNVVRITADGTDPLTDKGLSQAQRVAERLSAEHIDLIVSSPYIRSLKTAQMIAQHHPDTEFVIDNDMREIDLGSYLDKHYEEVDWINLAPDVESRESIRARAKSVFQRILTEHANDTVLFVAHNAFNKALIKLLRNWDCTRLDAVPQDNTAVSVFEISQNGCEELLFNCTAHLDESTASLRMD